jgi:hypothetical protein
MHDVRKVLQTSARFDDPSRGARGVLPEVPLRPRGAGAHVEATVSAYRVAAKVEAEARRRRRRFKWRGWLDFGITIQLVLLSALTGGAMIFILFLSVMLALRDCGCLPVAPSLAVITVSAGE